MKKLVVLFFVFISFNIFSQEMNEFSGTWKRNFGKIELDLKLNGKEIVSGNVYYKAGRIVLECIVNNKPFVGEVKLRIGKWTVDTKLDSTPINGIVYLKFASLGYDIKVNKKSCIGSKKGAMMKIKYDMNESDFKYDGYINGKMNKMEYFLKMNNKNITGEKSWSFGKVTYHLRFEDMTDEEIAFFILSEILDDKYRDK